VLWPIHHKAKPEPKAKVTIVSANELADDLAELADIHDNYPWLRSWAEPSLAVVNRLLSGDSPDAADDMEQLRHDIKALKAMEDNATI
jgi:hypothetical protein